MPSVYEESADPRVPTSPSASNHRRRASLKVLSRNIDNVVLGNLAFPTWYYSPYPDSVILGPDNHQSGNTAGEGRARHADEDHNGDASTAIGPATTTTLVNGVSKATAQLSTSKTAVPPKPVLDTLHVCPYCFRYTPSISDYAGHINIHSEAERIFRRRSAAHVKSRISDLRIEGTAKYNSINPVKPVPSTATKVYSHAGYTVWDVDGEVEKLYCQNLSLFGKLFLEQKSVFFDTSGFHYFVLTYCADEDDIARSARGMSSLASMAPDWRPPRRKISDGMTASAQPHSPLQSTGISLWANMDLKHHVMGFFSKENLSWDANNLACILVFPPYQHRSLGQLLMAVSYKLSGWEWEGSVIGGPEKPLSAMGRKSYARFWSERVARYVMGQSTDAEGLTIFEASVDMGEGKKRKRGKRPTRANLTVKALGDRTGMLGEDVVAALVGMEVCQLISPKRKKRTEGVDNAATDEDEQPRSMTIQRSKVLQWAEEQDVDLVSAVREEGFLGEWAMSDADEEEEEEENEEEAGEDSALVDELSQTS